jgi:hypothetical protein
MSSDMFKGGLGFSLIMMLGFLLLLAYLGAVGDNFICNQWKRKGMHTDIYFYVQCNMGQEANVLHSPVRTSSWPFLNVGSCLCLSSTQHLSQFHVRAIMCDRPGIADTWITVSQKVLGLVSAKLGQSAFSSVTTRGLTDRDITKLIVESEWCMFIGGGRHNCSEWQWHKWHYWHKLHMVGCQPVVPVVTGGPSGLQQRHPRSIKTLPHWAFSCCSCYTIVGGTDT